MKKEIGIVFNYQQLPDVHQFPFVIKKDLGRLKVQKGLFVHTETIDGFLIGTIEKILLVNEYFADPLTIKAYNNKNNINIIKSLFPSDEFEYAIAIVKTLGILEFDETDKYHLIKRIKRMTYPATPGKEVYALDENILKQFIGIDNKDGLLLGKVKVSNIDARININRLLNKHFAILSISGGGKSYLTSIIIEELLMRDGSRGTPAIIVIDVHGEYTYFKDLKKFTDKVKVFDCMYFQIAVPKLNGFTFKKYQEQISSVQVRELSKHIKSLKEERDKKSGYSLRDLIEHVEYGNLNIKSTKHALLGWLTELERLHLFGPVENPDLSEAIKPGHLTIFNLAREISIRKKQIIVDYICYRIFQMRRLGEIAPFLLIIEEAHQFCSESAQSKAISKNIIETIAREGRKFMACLCLISQRPKRLSSTALSQLNSKMILNIKNPYDLKHLMDSSEMITKELADMISSLGVGEMLLMGNAINYPIFIEVRKRKYEPAVEKISLTQACLDWVSKQVD